MQPQYLATELLVHAIGLILSCSVVSLPLLAEDRMSVLKSHPSACQQDSLHHHHLDTAAVAVLVHVVLDVVVAGVAGHMSIAHDHFACALEVV